MASIGKLTDNKLISLALQGYNPFQPDTGIFCGGYQGILYPNPTTLVAAGFDPYEFLDYMPTPYTPGGHYNGLDKGNPGIDYKNPGHILGLLDTFGRMSYGLRMLLDTHAGNNPSSFQPIININMPLSSIDGSFSPVGLSDIYPIFTEIPSDWFKAFTVGSRGVVTPQGRTGVEFPVSPVYTPSTKTIELQNLADLFSNKTLDSYLGLIQYFRNIIQQLASSVSSLSQKISVDFRLTNNGPTLFDIWDRISLGNYLGFEDNAINTIIGETVEPRTFVNFAGESKAYFQYGTATSLEALNILTGSTSYHNGPDGLAEYRSLTELNSVINLVPVQMVGGTSWKEVISRNRYEPGFVIEEASEIIGGVEAFENGRTISMINFMLVDFIIHVSNASESDQTVTLQGQGVCNNTILDPTQYWFESILVKTVNPLSLFPPAIINAAEIVDKRIDIMTSLNNELSWDKSWLGTVSNKDEEKFSDSIRIVEPTLSNPFFDDPSPPTPQIADTAPLIVDFNKTFVLKPGSNSIRLRARLISDHGLDIPANFVSDFWFSVFPISNVFSHIRLGDMDSVKQNFVSPGVQFSFSVTGTNMNSLNYNFEI